MFSGPFTKLLKRSPLDDIQQHMQVAVESAREVPGLLRALRDQNAGEFERIKTRIYDAENAADKLKNELRGRLPRTLFMPIARRDLLEVLHFQDSIADTAQNIADLLDERSMKVPAKLEEPLIALAEMQRARLRVFAAHHSKTGRVGRRRFSRRRRAPRPRNDRATQSV